MEDTDEAIRSELEHLTELARVSGKADERGDYARAQHYGHEATKTAERITRIATGRNYD